MSFCKPLASKAIMEQWLLFGLLALLVQKTISLHLSWITPREGSTAGGTTVQVYGSGFTTDQYTGQNFVYLGDIPCIVQGYTVSPTRLECITVPYPGAYEGFISQRLQSVIVTNGIRYQSTSYWARFRYNWNYTPQVRDVLPSSGPVNSLIEVGGYRFSTDISNRYTFIYLGDQLCDFWNENTNSIYGGRWLNGLYYIKCLVKQQIPGAWNVSAFLTGYSGMTWNHSQAMKLGHDGKLSMFELYPDIHSVQPQVGGRMGGTLLTLVGTGFGIDRSDMKLVVDIDGTPCEVIKRSQTEIQCWTREPSDKDEYNTAQGFRYQGSRGVTFHQFAGLNSYLVDDLYSFSSFPDHPDKVAVLPSFSPQTNINFDNYGGRYMAFFTPVQSGNHTFIIRSDYTAVLYLGKGNNISDLTEIARSNSYSGWNSDTTVYSSIRSDPIYMNEGVKYLLVGDLAEQYGADYLRVGVLMHETSFLHSETTQSVRERQLLEFTSHGHYDMQRIYIEINTSLADDSNEPMFKLEWGSRSKNITLFELATNEDTIMEATKELLTGICQFEPQLGVFGYFNDQPYDFESDNYVKETSYCGLWSYHVIYEAIIIDTNSEQLFVSSDYPFVCMAYKIPDNLQVDAIINIVGFGWRSISLISGIQKHRIAYLTDWSNGEYANDIIADDTWRFGCTNIHSLLTYLDSDQLKFEIAGFGFQTLTDSDVDVGFYVDVLSFTTQSLSIESHLPPSKPDGISVDQLIHTTEIGNTDGILHVDVTLEVVPTTCDHEIPMISLTLVEDINNTVINYGVQKLQNASKPVQGTYNLGMGGYWTDAIDYTADASYIRDVLNALPDISGTASAWYRSETLPQDKLGEYCPGRKLVIRFDKKPGDVPLLSLDYSNMTGHGLVASIKEIETGGFYQYPIPGYMLQSIEKTPQVNVRMNGNLAACGGELAPYEYYNTYTDPCGFTASDSFTPYVTSISPTSGSAGDIISIVGQGFSPVASENFVLLGEIECNVTESTNTSLTCVVGKGQAGSKTLWLHVLTGSVADTNGITFEYLVSVHTMDPITSGITAGIELSLTGDGFVNMQDAVFPSTSAGYSYSGYTSVLDGNCNSWKNKVIIGDNECEVTSFSQSMLNCVVPAGSAGSVDVTVTVYCDELNSTESYSTVYQEQFTYDSAMDPIITSVSPLSGSGRGGDMVTITGTGFINTADETTVMIGTSPCEIVSIVNITTIQCHTSSHAHGSGKVTVTLSGLGSAVSALEYQYILEVTEISKCSGSFLGGHLIVINGTGFGNNANGVAIAIDSIPCAIQTISNTEMKCLTGSITNTHKITNNAMNPSYGLGYAWDQPNINITVGDSIEWKWTGSAFTPLKRVIEVDSPSANEYNGYGFASKKAVKGSYTQTFSSPGTYHYIMEGYGEIGFRGSINVHPHTDVSGALTISFDSIEVSYNKSDTCKKNADGSISYSYLVNETPTIVSITPKTATQGSAVQITVKGISTLKEYIVLTIGGKPCTTSSHTSTTATKPIITLPPEGSNDYIDTAIICTVPDVYPGEYRIILHVTDHGWAYGEISDTIVSVTASIQKDYSTFDGSQAGGSLLTIPIIGIDPFLIGQTSVHIGNTPCHVQHIADTSTNPLQSDIVCRTVVPRDDGYSSLVSNRAMSYWSLQFDFYDSSNVKYSSESTLSFSNAGRTSSNSPANIVGSVLQGEPGISGEQYIDQSAYFSSSYLEVTSFEEFQALDSFSFELWFRSMSPSDKYVVLASSYQTDHQSAEGFIVALNPCNEIEFRLGTGEHIEDTLFFNSSQDDCDDLSDCYSSLKECTLQNLENSSYEFQLPVGDWTVLRSDPLVNASKWNHIVFGFDVIDKGEPSFGYQRMFINGEFYETDTSYQHANESDIMFGGNKILHTKMISALDDSELSPFIGYIDEICLYDYMLDEKDVDIHYHYGRTDQQPIWIKTEKVDGVGKGMVPNTDVPIYQTSYDELVLDVNLQDLNDDSFTISQQKGVRIEWTGIHGITQVASSSYDNCLQFDAVKEWSPAQNNGDVIIWLESGQTYYFIDSVGDNCNDGIKFKITVGSTTIIDWTIGDHSDVTITEGDGVVFKWDDVVSHNVIEMSSSESVSTECTFVGGNAASLGKVVKEWHSISTYSGEVSISDLSVGKHYFVCSVGSHCKLGMRLTVTVLAQNINEVLEQDSNEHIVPWYIPTTPYEPLNVIEGEDIVFAWNAFHSLHQVDEDVYESCDTSLIPLYEWGRPSVDNSVTITGLRSGTYYFICSVSGHCNAGMKIEVHVNARELVLLDDPFTASCDTASGLCSFSYSDNITPILLSVESSTFKSGDKIQLQISNYNFSVSANIGDPLDTTATVFIGNYPCTDVVLSKITDQYHEITCTAPNLDVGSYNIRVEINGIGFTKPKGSIAVNKFDDNAFVVTVVGVVNDVMPASGSIGGGTKITLTGTGFSYVSDNLNVNIGGHVCSVVESTTDRIVCITSSVASSQSDVPISVSVKGNQISNSLTFDYLLDSTPIVNGLSKTENVIGGDTLTITGEKFSSNKSEITVEILNTDESFDHDPESNDIVCEIITSTETTINCTVPYRGAGVFWVAVHVRGKGLSRKHSTSSLEYVLAIEGLSPKKSSHGGGLTMNITGSGFSLDSEENIEITVCSSPCRVIRVFSQGLLSCSIRPSGIDATTDITCDVVMSYNGLSASTQNFTYSSSLTAHVNSISPSSGGTAGGTLVTITGEGFMPLGISSPNDLQQEDIVVTIDEAVCDWYNQNISPNDSVILCQTSDHRTTVFAEITVFIQGKGNALIVNGLSYQYVDRWSSKYTWGGLEPPREGESVYIKEGQTVFFDTNTPVLNLILIEGALIFEDEQDVHLQAKYIFINNGKLQIGTEQNPFTHRATITLHGNIRDPEIPIYGAKVIGIRQGELDIHGQKRTTTWTRLSSTAFRNSSFLELQDSVDWLPGDSIVIAPTGKEGNETETNVIDSVSDDGLTVYLRDKLTSTHYGITETFENGESIEIRAEVGLLSHNVIIQGALEENEIFDGTGADQYGMQIMIHRTGPHPTPIRIENTEVRYAGQAFRLGRYAIHFHLSGNMSSSYIKNCAIHHSNNRALTAHGVHNLLIEGNVAYDIKGHAFFIEDGIETNNRYIRNLGIYVRGSSSLLNTDQLPAVFWITNPNNVFIENAAVASRAYGFWYDLDGSPTGPSYTPGVCPNKEVFGQFSGNVAHSCNEFGLRIWETYTPYNDGCGAKDPSTAMLYNFTTYSNDIHGVEFSVIGNVRAIGFKIADNRDNGIEIQETIGDSKEATIEDSLIISHTSVNNGEPGTGGIKTPNTRGLKVSNVTFANFNFPHTACLRACSHCKLLQGGFQVSVEKLKFIGNSSYHKTSFQWEHEVLFHDLDGSLSGEVGGWVMPDSDLHPPQFCTKSLPEFSVNQNVPGTVCSADIYMLRMAWNAARPLVTLQGISVNVSNEFGSSIVPWRHYRLTHMDGYMLTMPSKYTYSFEWLLPSEHLVDVTSYSAGMYSMISDEYVIIDHEFVQVPDHVNIAGNRDSNEQQLDSADPNFSWFIDNITDSVSYIVSSKNTSNGLTDRLWTYSYEPCPVDGCPLPPDPEDKPLETTQRRWSDPNSWPNGTLPVEGEDVIIQSSWRMLFDISPPPLGLVDINGELQFEDSRDYNFTANIILVRGPNAHLIVGSEESPFSHKAVITLTGKRNDEPLFLSISAIVGSKAFGIFGNVTMIGEPKSHSWTRLDQSCAAGDSVIYLKGQPDWTIGDQIVISSSSYEPSEAEIRSIIDYDSTIGAVTIDEPLEYDHNVHKFLSDQQLSTWINSSLNDSTWWGGTERDVTLSPEVGLLSHNIIIQGGEYVDEPIEIHHYGCRIMIGEYSSAVSTYTGTVAIDSVEVRFCGQGGYFSPTDPRYSVVFKDIENSESYIKHSSIHHGYNTGVGIHSTTGVQITDNVIHRTTGSSVKCGGFNNYILGNLAMLTSTVQPNTPLDNHAVDFPATFDINRDNIVKDNAAAGSHRIAYRYSGDECDGNREPKKGEQANFWNNTAHSGLIALVILGLPKDCASVGGLTASHHWDYSVFSSSSSSIAITHMKLAIGKIGINLNIFGPNSVSHLLGGKSTKIENSLIVGFIPEMPCQSSKPLNSIPGVSLSKGDPSIGIMMSSFNNKKSKMDGTGKWHLMKGYPTVDGIATATNVTFAHFAKPQNCEYNSALISNNPISPDAVHPLDIMGVIKLDVPQENLVHFYDPNPDWINQEDCIDMDCDGPKHALIRDVDGTFGGTAPKIGSIAPFAELRFSNYSSRIPLTWLDFEDSVSLPESVVDYRGIYRGELLNLESDKSCEWMESWNAYHCFGLDHLMLIIESMDGDTETRRLSPLALVASGTEEYTDLLNGPMDHGWCTYYTCLKRLSTFYSIVSTDIDYHLWMTGSLPGSLRFHLLNSDDSQTIRINIWYKDPRRKDVYKNGVFIESQNTNFLDNGAVTQLNGDYTPTFDSYSGANYFDKKTQILTILLKGSVPVEIRTPPVIQISLNVAVTVEEFFLSNLISNLAFVLKIDVSRIRVVNIVAENSAVKRDTLSDGAINTVTLEFGDPPATNVDPPLTTTPDQDWMENDGENDNVDVKEEIVSTTTQDDSDNPFNEEAPESDEEFATIYNDQAQSYSNSVLEYSNLVAEVDQVNQLGSDVIELVQSGGLREYSVNSATLTPAVPPASPVPPVLPLQYINILDSGNVTLATINGTVSGSTDEPTPIVFLIPDKLIVSREPNSSTGHLVYVELSVVDANGEIVQTLGYLNPWKCVASLIATDHSESAPRIEGQTEVVFVAGIAVFTRLRVNKPSSNLRLSFITNPGSFEATTFMSFSVVEPSDDVVRKEIILKFIGNTATLSTLKYSDVIDDLKLSLSQILDVDLSRIQNVEFIVKGANDLQVSFYLLDSMPTDPPDVPSLSQSILKLQNHVDNMTFTILINGTSFKGQNGSIEILLPTQEPLSNPIIVIIAIATVGSSIILLMFGVAICVYCTNESKRKKTSPKTSTDDDDSVGDELRMLRIPKASLVHPRPILMPHHPHSLESWIDEPATEVETIDGDELWSALGDSPYQSDQSIWNFSTPQQMPRIPRAFSGLPSSTQNRQARTLANLS